MWLFFFFSKTLRRSKFDASLTFFRFILLVPIIKWSSPAYPWEFLCTSYALFSGQCFVCCFPPSLLAWTQRKSEVPFFSIKRNGPSDFIRQKMSPWDREETSLHATPRKKYSFKRSVALVSSHLKKVHQLVQQSISIRCRFRLPMQAHAAPRRRSTTPSSPTTLKFGFGTQGRSARGASMPTPPPQLKSNPNSVVVPFNFELKLQSKSIIQWNCEHSNQLACLKIFARASEWARWFCPGKKRKGMACAGSVISLSKTDDRWSCQRVLNIQIREFSSLLSAAAIFDRYASGNWNLLDCTTIHADPHAWAFGAAKKQPYMWAARACALHVAKCQSKRRIESVPVGWGAGGRAGGQADLLFLLRPWMGRRPLLAQVPARTYTYLQMRLALRLRWVGLDPTERNHWIAFTKARAAHCIHPQTTGGCRLPLPVFISAVGSPHVGSTRLSMRRTDRAGLCGRSRRQ